MKMSNVFRLMRSKSEPWSLATVKLPWGETQSLYEFISTDPQAALPEEDHGAGLKWAPGALDGVMGHHVGRGDTADDVSRVLAALRALLANASSTNLEKFYDAVCETQVLGYVDQLLTAIGAGWPIHRHS